MAAEKVEHNGVDVKAGAPSASVDDASMRVSVSHATFRCRRGYGLYTTTYTPAVRRGHACLVFHHGLSDHSERHCAVLSHLCDTVGMTVYTYDAHGHGRSGPPGEVGRALIRCFDDMVDDVLDFTRLFVIPAETTRGAAEAAGEGPAEASSPAEAAAGQQGASGVRQGQLPRIFLMGYSMGGLTCILAASASMCSSSSPASSSSTTATAAASAGGPTANGVVPVCTTSASGCGGGNLYSGLLLTSSLTDPLYGTNRVLRAIKLSYVTLMSWVAPALPMFKRNPIEAGIRDPAALAEMASDMLWYRGNFKVATVASMLWGCQRLHRTAHALKPLPLYVQHASVDVACSLASMRAFLARIRPVDLTMHVVEGAYHDLHHDPATPELLGHMVAWLTKRTR